MVELETGKKIKRLRSDNGGEYVNHDFENFLVESGIKFDRTVPYTPQQNGVAERANGTIFNTARCLLFDAKLPKEFWAEAVSHAVYLRNRSPSSSLTDSVPQGAYTSVPPRMDHLRVFGCQCWPLVQKEHRTKLDPRAKRMIFLGYKEGTKGYRLYDAVERKMVISRDVLRFDEDIPGNCDETVKGTSLAQEWETVGDIAGNLEAVGAGQREDEEGQDPDRFPTPEPAMAPIPPPFLSPSPSPDPSTAQAPTPPPSDSDQDDHDEDSDGQSPPLARKDSVESSHSENRRSTRTIRRPGQWWKATASVPAIQCGEDSDGASEPVAEAHSTTMASDVPHGYRQATAQPEIWGSAIKAEQDSLLAAGTFIKVPYSSLPPGTPIVRSHYLFSNKLDSEGALVKRKCRIVANGSTQEKGVNYDEVYAPTQHRVTLRVLLSLICREDLEADQTDVRTAFLNGDLQQTVHMHIPEGMKTGEDEDMVALLKKSLYGLKQAANAWYKCFDGWIIESGFKHATADLCLYLFRKSDSFIWLAIHVDDSVLISNNRAELDGFKCSFAKRFNLDDRGALQYFLGMQIKRDRQKSLLWISQQRYLTDVLARFNMSDCNSVSTPMDPGYQFSPATDEEYEAVKDFPFQQVVGSLQYATLVSRPDFQFAVNKLGQSNAKWNQAAVSAAKHLLRYVAGTLDLSLCYGLDKSALSLIGYADADYAGCKVTRRSTTGYAFFVGGDLFSWKSKRQPTVAQSTCEAEYMSCGNAAKEAVWLERLLTDLDRKPSGPVPLFNDNTGCVSNCSHVGNHDSMKHVDVLHHAIRELTERKKISVTRVGTKDMKADVFTKPLPRLVHEQQVDMLGLRRYGSPLSSGSVKK